MYDIRIEGNGEKWMFRLENNQILSIGRLTGQEQSSTTALKLPSKVISRKHATIAVIDEKVSHTKM